jgi:hypothetical protein
MIEIVILLVVVVAVLCVIASRLGKANEFLKEILANSRRKPYQPQQEIEEEPLPPPLTLDEAPQTEIRAKE